MVDILVRKSIERFEFSIAKGLEEIKEIIPDFNIGKITIEPSTFFDLERTFGIGTFRKEVPVMFGIEGKLNYRFVNEYGDEIPPIKQKIAF